jgi:hypothetical protein
LTDVVPDALKAPFPWFGGKSRVADIVWERFGDVANYCEPFFGSGAVLLGRPTDPGIETVNDLDCMVANFWRALKHDPEAVARHADWPVNEADQHARHFWLCSQEEFRERMKVDPGYYDARVAGWWVWGQSIWIGGGWCATQRPHLGNAGMGIHRKRPHLGNAGMGIHRKRPHLGDAGTGIHRKRPHLGNAGTGERLLGYMLQLAERMRSVRVCCGEWHRILGPTPTVKNGITGVFLDPPYAAEAGRTEDIYACDSLSIARDVREWAISNGDNPDMRIALCGYEGEHQMPGAWDCIAWKASGGYGSQGNGNGRENATKERIWFSPHCLNGRQQGLFTSKN